MAVHRFFKRVPVYGVAHNCLPDRLVKMTAASYAKKTAILSATYFSETERFINFVPATFAEGFVKLSLREVESIHEFLSQENGELPKNLKKYKWFAPYFASFKARLKERPF